MSEAARLDVVNLQVGPMDAQQVCPSDQSDRQQAMPTQQHTVGLSVARHAQSMAW